MRTGGTSSSEVNPKRYSLVLFAADMVLATSNEIQSISSSVSTIALGVIIEVINALLSLSNASFLNPEETRESCPKLEFDTQVSTTFRIKVLIESNRKDGHTLNKGIISCLYMTCFPSTSIN